MKRFFITVFGGLFAIAAGLALSYGAGTIWRAAISEWRESALAEGTTIDGFRKLVRYTAHDEEDILSTTNLANLRAATGEVTAKSYLVKNLSRDEEPLSKNADQLRPIASLTKLVTAVVARDLVAPNAKVNITKNIIATYGNTAGFRVGETFTSSDLLYPLLMVSSNDAAEALAQHYGRKRFIAKMNEFTQSIGAYRTYLVDPSGISPANVSTANDMAIILDWIRKNDPEILEITELKTKTVRNHTWVNPTHFLAWSNYNGGKNGYIPESNRTAASLFTVGKDKHQYAVILLGSSARDADEVRLLRKVTE